MTEPRWISFVHALPWAKPILALVAWVKSWRTKPDPLAGLSRKHRRAILFASSAEIRMRRERTAARWAKRHAHRKRSDGGAKTKRAYLYGVRDGRLMTLAALKRRIESKQSIGAPVQSAA